MKCYIHLDIVALLNFTSSGILCNLIVAGKILNKEMKPIKKKRKTHCKKKKIN